MIADYLADTRATLGRIDHGQVRMMVGYLKRLRNRKGTLHLLSTHGLPTAGVSKQTGIKIRTCWSGQLLTNDALLITVPHQLTNISSEPVILSICGAADGDLARHSACSIIIPSFAPQIVAGLTSVVWQALIGELS